MVLEFELLRNLTTTPILIWESLIGDYELFILLFQAYISDL